MRASSIPKGIAYFLAATHFKRCHKFLTALSILKVACCLFPRTPLIPEDSVYSQGGCLLPCTSFSQGGCLLPGTTCSQRSHLLPRHHQFPREPPTPQEPSVLKEAAYSSGTTYSQGCCLLHRHHLFLRGPPTPQAPPIPEGIIYSQGRCLFPRVPPIPESVTSTFGHCYFSRNPVYSPELLPPKQFIPERITYSCRRHLSLATLGIFPRATRTSEVVTYSKG